MIMKSFALFAVLAISSAACSSAPTPDTLIGQWEVTAIAGESGDLAPPVKGTTLTANIADTEINGSSGCNNYMGAAAIDGSSVSFGPLAGTLKMCPAQGVMDQEHSFTTMLQSVDSWEGTSVGIDLKSEGNTIIQLVAVDTTLAGSSWDVMALNNQSGGVQSVVAESGPTLVFDEESGVTGSTGCNNFFGTYSTDGDSIEFSGLGATEAFCEDTSDQEVWMMAALANATTYTVDSTTLDLFDADGSRLLTANR